MNTDMPIMKLKLIAAALALAAAFPAHAAGPHVVLEKVGTPTIGQSFDLRLVLEDPFGGLASDEQLLAVGFHLAFDTSALQLASFAVASGWEDDSARLAPDVFSASIFPGVDNANQGSLVLGTLHFDALRAGSTRVSLTTDAGDFNQGLIYLEADPRVFEGAETLRVAAAVPEPGAFVLMVAGLGLVGWRGRRRGA